MLWRIAIKRCCSVRHAAEGVAVGQQSSIRGPKEIHLLTVGSCLCYRRFSQSLVIHGFRVIMLLTGLMFHAMTLRADTRVNARVMLMFTGLATSQLFKKGITSGYTT